MKSMKPQVYVTMKTTKDVRQLLKLLAASRGKSMIEVLREVVQREWDQETGGGGRS